MIPAQSRFTEVDLVEQFLKEVKPITKLRVLALNSHKVSWYEDAKSCSRIFTRMVRSRAICPKIVPLTSAWANMLLHYAVDYGIEDPKPTILTSTSIPITMNTWLIPMLMEIAGTTSVNHENLRGQGVKAFCWYITDTGKILSVANPLCSITHRPMESFEKGAVWLTTLEDGKEIYSQATGANVFKWLEQMIKQGLQRHKKAEFRDELSRKIRERHKI